MLTTSGQQFTDWSAAYRIFERARFDPRTLFATARREATATVAAPAPIVAVMDDTLLRKRGRHVPGASWRRDPLGPPFQTNLVWAQRFLQVSLAVPERDGAASRARGIPIDLLHCPTPRKPKSTASAAAQAAYEEQRRAARISVCGASRVMALRRDLDADGEQRPLLVAVDGGYTNRALFTAIPERTTIIGRIRKDARLFAPPPQPTGVRGRRRSYGDALPTPEAIRQDPSIPWHTVPVFLAGNTVTIDAKVVSAVRWREGAGARDMQLVIVRPLGYRPSATSKIAYRNPGYLIVSDTTLDLATILQTYIWRWEIELNFRDEKTLLGAGQAQVRNENAVALVPALTVASYAILLLAHHRTASCDRLPRPRWQPPLKHRRERDTTALIIRQLRAELWGQALGIQNFSGFAARPARTANAENYTNNATSAVLYAIN